MENKCDDCGKIFGSAYALKRHQSLHRGDAKTYTCPICSKTFNRNYNLTRHLNLHTQEQKFLCDICYRPFNDYSCVKKHRLSHFPPSQYTCEYCQQKFNRRGNLRVHLVSKHLGNKRTWKDVVDSGQVGDDDELKPAVKYVKKEQNSVVNEEIGNTVTGERKHGHDAGPYNEQESDSGFRNIKSIDREKDETVHLLEDNEIKVELAEESGEEMSTDDQAEKSSTYSMDCFVATTNHSTYDQAEKSRTYSVDSLVTTTDHSAEGEIKIRLVNGKAFNEDVSCWQCALCDKVLSCKSHLDTHMERHKAIRKYNCDHCTKTFKTKDDLQRHQRTYLNPLRLECQYCGKVFNKHTNLKRHLRLHTGEKPYHCFTCNQSFSDPTNFKNHKWKHSDKNPWFCDKCNKTYSTKKALGVHVCSNPDLVERDSYQCNICEKKYSSSKSLRTHKSSHTREITRKAFECQLCGQKFKWQTRYESHFISHVREEEERRSQRAILERGMTELANLARKEDDDRKASQKAHSNHANVETKGSEHGNYSNGEKTRKTNTDDSELGIVTNERCTLDGVKKVEPLETEFQVDESVYKVSARYDSHLIKCIIAEEEKRK